MNTSGLRLMVFDTTDVKRSFKLPGVDADVSPIEVDIGLSHSWFAGGALYRSMRRLDQYKGFDSWAATFEWLNTVGEGYKIAQIQYWGHGSPGRVLMNRKALNQGSFFGEHAAALRKLASRLTPESLVWFRTCSTFAGDPGRRFAQVWSQALGCQVAAHTHLVGFWQSGLHSIAPGDLPHWPAAEGIEAGTAAEPTKLKWSAPWIPNTITCLGGSVPKGW
jgi:hypothetical protein